VREDAVTLTGLVSEQKAADKHPPSPEPVTEQRRYTAQVLGGLAEWVEQTLTDAEYAKGKDRYMPIHHDESCGIAWAREKILAHIRELVP
jgi:hypothetical protein